VVHRRAGVGVGTHHPRRVRDAGDRIGRQRVHDVAPVGRQAQRVGGRAARLGVLAGDPSDLHDGQRRPVREHDRHLQDRADRGADVRLGVVDERLRAVAALQQERPALGDVGQPCLQPVDLGRQGDRRNALQHGAHVRDVHGVGPVGLLGRRTGEGVVEAGAHVTGQGWQLGQHFDRGVDGPVHKGPA
jgi:hypothetical protein